MGDQENSASGLASELQGPQLDSSAVSDIEARLFFAFVRTIGTNLKPFAQTLSKTIKAAGYDHDFEEAEVRLSGLLSKLDPSMSFLRESPIHKRFQTHMDLGDFFRSESNEKAAVALLGVAEILERQRRRIERETSPRSRGGAYTIKSLMHPHEVDVMRQIYGTSLFVISASAPHGDRLDWLATKISRSAGWDPDECMAIAIDLMNRDAGLFSRGGKYSYEPHPEVQRCVEYPAESGFFVEVGKTFEMADVFVSSARRPESTRTIERLVELIFSHPFNTPTSDEMGMYTAYGFATQSASLARQVGAAIFTPDGQIVAGGANEVPKFGGGLYRAEEYPDHREFQEEGDENDPTKRELLLDLLVRLRASDWLVDSYASLTAFLGE